MARLRQRARDLPGDLARALSAPISVPSPGQHVRAVLSGTADLVQPVAPLDLHQAFGLDVLAW